MSTAVITLESMIVASSEQISSRVADDVVIMDMKNGSYFALDEIGVLVWGLIAERPHSVEALRDAIMAEYDVDAVQCEADLLELLGELAAEQLIEVRSAASKPATR